MHPAEDVLGAQCAESNLHGKMSSMKDPSSCLVQPPPVTNPSAPFSWLSLGPEQGKLFSLSWQCSEWSGLEWDALGAHRS